MNGERRGHWYLLTGFLLGAALGLVYAWIISPVHYVDTNPAALSNSYKDQYRLMIALAYQTDLDLGRAQERLKLVDAANPARELAAQAQRMQAANASPQEVRALALLAYSIGKPEQALANTAATRTAAASHKPSAESPSVETSPSETFLPGQTALHPSATVDLAEAIRTATQPLPTITPTPTQTATITLTPLPTFTPHPSATPRPVQDAPLSLIQQSQVCEPGLTPNLLQIEVSDAKANFLPGVKIIVTWQEGESTFYTGLSPEINAGYADFKMQPGVEYTLKAGETGEEISGLKAEGTCGILLEFSQK